MSWSPPQVARLEAIWRRFGAGTTTLQEPPAPPPASPILPAVPSALMVAERGAPPPVSAQARVSQWLQAAPWVTGAQQTTPTVENFTKPSIKQYKINQEDVKIVALLKMSNWAGDVNRPSSEILAGATKGNFYASKSTWIGEKPNQNGAFIDGIGQPVGVGEWGPRRIGQQQVTIRNPGALLVLAGTPTGPTKVGDWLRLAAWAGAREELPTAPLATRSVTPKAPAEPMAERSVGPGRRSAPAEETQVGAWLKQAAWLAPTATGVRQLETSRPPAPVAKGRTVAAPAQVPPPRPQSPQGEGLSAGATSIHQVLRQVAEHPGALQHRAPGPVEVPSVARESAHQPSASLTLPPPTEAAVVVPPTLSPPPLPKLEAHAIAPGEPHLAELPEPLAAPGEGAAQPPAPALEVAPPPVAVVSADLLAQFASQAAPVAEAEGDSAKPVDAGKTRTPFFKAPAAYRRKGSTSGSLGRSRSGDGASRTFSRQSLAALAEAPAEGEDAPPLAAAQPIAETLATAPVAATAAAPSAGATAVTVAAPAEAPVAMALPQSLADAEAAAVAAPATGTAVAADSAEAATQAAATVPPVEAPADAAPLAAARPTPVADTAPAPLAEPMAGPAAPVTATVAAGETPTAATLGTQGPPETRATAPAQAEPVAQLSGAGQVAAESVLGAEPPPREVLRISIPAGAQSPAGQAGPLAGIPAARNPVLAGWHSALAQIRRFSTRPPLPTDSANSAPAHRLDRPPTP